MGAIREEPQKKKNMTESEISTIVKNATSFLEKEYVTFLECVWNEKENCFTYSFKSHIDAEKFVMWKQLQNNQFRLVLKPHHADWSTVSEYR